MKYLITVLLLITYISCSESQAYTDQPKEIIKESIKTSKLNDIDKLLIKNRETKRIADSISKMSDMAVNRKVDRQVKVMTVLKYKVVELKQSNEVLKVEIDSLTNIGKSYKLLPISYNEDHR